MRTLWDLVSLRCIYLAGQCSHALTEAGSLMMDGNEINVSIGGL